MTINTATTIQELLDLGILGTQQGMRILQHAKSRHLAGVDLLGVLEADRRSAAATGPACGRQPRRGQHKAVGSRAH